MGRGPGRWCFLVSFAAAALYAAAYGGRRRRFCLLIVLICCSPVLLPLTFLSFPLLCVAAFCLRFGRRRKPPADGDGATFLKRCEEGEVPESPSPEGAVNDEGALLQRYLEDQLELIVASGDKDGTFVIS